MVADQKSEAIREADLGPSAEVSHQAGSSTPVHPVYEVEPPKVRVEFRNQHSILTVGFGPTSGIELETPIASEDRVDQRDS